MNRLRGSVDIECFFGGRPSAIWSAIGALRSSLIVGGQCPQSDEGKCHIVSSEFTLRIEFAVFRKMHLSRAVADGIYI
jgi:hypothetical protein